MINQKKTNKENLSEIVNINTIIGENKVFYHEDSLCMLIQEPDGSIKEIYEL